ncbi:terpene synthase family protein [Lipingzhangella sp. LS1_29]|uniref:Terpene synthase n=1 Tax=Lipingzhangella rawalii TaxID=2055835 RepID=A0ABU2HAR3_9ACTN|nr:terpene synthase family protein [Lipingzhangella rawalii]MDS1272356.1 terpene synthase family protein [Lipingzhangella rawalii]
MSAKLTLPDMTVNIPAKCHPDIDRIERDATSWAADRVQPDTLRRIRNTRAGRIVARTVSSDCPRSLLDAYAHFLVWGFWFDDLCVDDVEPDAPLRTAAIASVLEILDTGKGTGAAGHGVEAALAEVLNELEAALSPAQMARWRQEMRTWFCSMVFQNAMRQQTPTINSYKALRRYSVCTYPCLVLIEASHGAHVDREAWPHTGLEELRVHCSNQVGWSNDVVSYHMEREHPGGFWNLPTVYQAHGLTEREAVQRSADDSVAEAQIFARKESELRGHLTAGQLCSVDAMRSWMRGCLDWHLEATDRYFGWAAEERV